MADPELIAKFRQLEALDRSLHLFCDDADRRRLVFDSLQLFAYDGPDAIPWHQQLQGWIDQALQTCDSCVVAYYQGKKAWIERLRDDFEDDDVELFTRMIDDKDIARIQGGLSTAVSTLRALPPERRHQSALPGPAVFALFEALANDVFLRDEAHLAPTFNEAFRLVQTNRVLKIARYLPAMARFAFAADAPRSDWARQSWSRMPALLTAEDFEYAIRGPLEAKLTEVLETMPDAPGMQIFWAGLRIIIAKLPPSLITHSLRAMDQDVYRLALDHLQIESEGVRDLLQVLRMLLEKGPRDFWNAMGAIAPTTVIEQVFNSPAFDQIAFLTKEGVAVAAFEDLLTWMDPFMASLQTSHKPAAARALVSQLMSRLQRSQYPLQARNTAFRFGMQVLAQTLEDFVNATFVLEQVGRIVAMESIAIFAQHSDVLFDILQGRFGEGDQGPLVERAGQAVSDALQLECKLVQSDRDRIQHDISLPGAFAIYRPIVWRRVEKCMADDSLQLMKAVFSSALGVIGLEKFDSKQPPKRPREEKEFNDMYAWFVGKVQIIIEKANDFRLADFRLLMDDSVMTSGIMTLTFSGDPLLAQSATDIVKNLSSESSRRDAFRFLIRQQPFAILDAVSTAALRLAQRKAFAPIERMFKICTDIVSALCDSQDGLLRSMTLSDRYRSAVSKLWATLWKTLDLVYQQTQAWSEDHRNNRMMDFCRDVMQFSGYLFEQFSVFDTAITSASSSKGDSPSNETLSQPTSDDSLLSYPLQALKAMTKYLRLRDEFLLLTSVQLIRQLLLQMTGKGLKLSEEASDELHRLATVPKYTNMSSQQKAEILRLLEENLGYSLASGVSTPEHASVSSSNKSGFKQGRLDMQGWLSKARSPVEIDDTLTSITPAAERLKALQNGKTAGPAKTTALPTRLPARALPDPEVEKRKQAQRDAFVAARREERKEKERRDAEAAARQKKNIMPHTIAGQTSSEGSALSKLGDIAKENRPKLPGIMVDSASESEADDDDDIDEALFGPSKGNKQSAAVRDYNKNRSTQIVRQGPVKKVRQTRSAKDMRARVAPDLSSLHSILLKWDLFHDGEFPPSSSRDDFSLVASEFRTAQEYTQTFQPLLLLEAWQGFRQSLEEASSKPFSIKIGNQMSIDQLMELSSMVEQQTVKDIGLSEGDILLLSTDAKPSSAPASLHALGRLYRIIRKGKTMEITIRIAHGTPFLSSLRKDTVVYAEKITSIIPLEREYTALLGLVYYDLCEEIVRAYPSPLLPYSDATLAKVERLYDLNKAQAKAVQSAIDNDAFTLVQGPPGTGKTKTIVATVGALLSAELKDVGAVAIGNPAALSVGQRNNAPVPKKLLVCAPSNAAVDELVMRLMKGVKTLNGRQHQIKVLRLGRSDNINPKVLSVTLDEQVNKQLNLSRDREKKIEQVQNLKQEHKKVSDELIAMRTTLDELNSKGSKADGQQYRELEALKRKKQSLGNLIDRESDFGETLARNAEIQRNEVRQSIINGAHVICATLSGSGHDMFRNLKIDFETVIIDEAAQSIELSALIPLKYGCSKCIMVGDPKQLPPTVLSREAAKFQYEQSLFVRMQSNSPENVHLLDTQYRMHPEISRFPSQAFYEGRLRDGPNMAALRRRPWHVDEVLGPYRFFDVQGMQRSAPKGHSLVNEAEVQVAIRLYKRLLACAPGYDLAGKIGIITPYKSQLGLLKDRFRHEFGEDIRTAIEFNTTDAFQGRESEVIIFSCVRASNRGIGFLSDIRRMNVGITRAQSSLWVLGNTQSLTQGEYWRQMITDARTRGRLVEDTPSALQRPPKGGAPAASKGPTPDLLPKDIRTEPEADKSRRVSSSKGSSSPSRSSSPNSAFAPSTSSKTTLDPPTNANAASPAATHPLTTVGGPPTLTARLGSEARSDASRSGSQERKRALPSPTDEEAREPKFAKTQVTAASHVPPRRPSPRPPMRPPAPSKKRDEDSAFIRRKPRR